MPVKASAVWPHLSVSSQRSQADIYRIEACSAAEHEWQWTQSKELLWRLGYLCMVATRPMPKLCSHGNQSCTCQARELVGADAGQSQRSMATPVAIITEVTDGHLQGSSLLSGRT